MRTVLVAALVALAVSVGVRLVVEPERSPSEPAAPDIGLERRIDALDRAFTARVAKEGARLEGRGEAPLQRVQALEARLEVLEGAAGEARVVAASEADAAAAEARDAVLRRAEAECQRWIDRLWDSNENVAFSATIELGRLGNPRAVRPLAYVLGTHPDVFVRLGAATAIGDMKARDGLEALVDALLDKDALVRTAANDGLVKTTSLQVPFAQDATEEQLKEAQAAWRTWIRENAASLPEPREP